MDTSAWSLSHAVVKGFDAEEVGDSSYTRSAAAEFAAFVLDTQLDIAIPALALDAAFASSWARNMPMCQMRVYILAMPDVMLPLIGSSLLQALRTSLLSMAAQELAPSGNDSLLAALKREVLDLIVASDKAGVS